MSTGGGALPFTREAIATGACTIEAVLAAIPGAARRIAVNVVHDGNVLVCSTGNLERLLETRPQRVELDLLPEDVFRGLVAARARSARELLTPLRRLLCVQPLPQIASELAAMLRTLEEIAVMLDVYRLQRSNRTVDRCCRELDASCAQLRTAAGVAGDNVLCSDELWHVLRPQLETLAATFTAQSR